ncbi:MAG TPA: HDOD domain-containing protein [Noviherbaspirillum sp.]|uniref:HDOD domain-containing protein n=1 Tax=Noviherbaspirillum sp. TaxID=1926288 RepID=UPI002D5363E0|nr:HDOD domain-containing protein [Noviherbaspirillum sp.]HYD94258.1 HDOD domain-containing protein [Noviherbaspirillum sp.]
MTTTFPLPRADADRTMELLWSRVRQRGDLPGFSKVVSAIIGAMRGDDDHEFNMTRTVLQDPALTQKVLRLANSAMYSVFGQGINTVSKAVLVLGTETIGHLALGLKLVDGLSSASSESAGARIELEKAVMAGHIARQVASTATTRDAEEAVVCSMLHSLGRMMASFYLPELWSEAEAYRVASGVSENQAANEILGLSLDDVGRLVARQWGLPATLVDTMREVPPRPVGEPLDHMDWLAAISTLSSRCADAVCADDEKGRAMLATLANGYADMLGLEPSQIMGSVEVARQTATDEDAVTVRPARRASDAVRSPAPTAGKPGDAAGILARGAVDMRDALQSASLAQILSMGLETIFQGLGFSRVIAFLRDQEQSRYAAQMSLGEGVQDLLPRLVFGDAYQPDVFHASLANDKMIFVENAGDPAFSSKLPRWWKEALPTSRSFMVLPLSINRNPVGFIYGDWDRSAPLARIEQPEIGPLNEIRLLVVNAIEQRRHTEPAWMRKLF